MSGYWAEGFYHWMIEWLTRVLVAESAGFRGVYLVPAQRSFVLQSLEPLGIPESRIQLYSRKNAEI